MAGEQAASNTYYSGESGFWATRLKAYLSEAGITAYRLAAEYSEVVRQDRDRGQCGVGRPIKRARATLPQKEVRSWLGGKIPGVAVAWRVGEALARTGLPVTGLDGLVAAGYGREAIGLVGVILGRWHKDGWDALSKADAVKRGLGLAAARAVGFERLVELPIPRREPWASFPQDDDDPKSAQTVLYDYYSETDLLPGIFEQEQDNEESLRALVLHREKLTETWTKWRTQTHKIEHAFDEYQVAFSAMNLNSDVGKRAARDVLVGYGFGITVFEEGYGEVVDPRFPHFEIIASQIQEEPMGVPRMGYTRIGNRFA